MSISSSSFQCTYISENEQYMTDLICRTSDLIQRYSGTPSNPVILPEYDWSVKKPVVRILFASASPGMTDAVLKQKILNGATKWWINDTELTFSETTGVSGGPAAFSGLFEKIPANTNNDYPFGGLRILGNLVTALGGVSGVLKCQVSFTDNQNNTVTKIHTINIGCRMFSSDGYELEVYTDDSFVLTMEDPTALLRARMWKGAEKVFDSATSTAKTLRWYTYDATAGVEDWTEIAAATNGAGETVFAYNAQRELTVGRDGVPTFLTVRAAVFGSATETDITKAEATGTARVNDETDALYISPNPTPADGVLRAGETTPDGVTFAPKTYDKDTKKEVTGVKYKFTCFSPAGTVLNNVTSGTYDSNANGLADNSELLASYKVSRAMFEGIGADITVQIDAFRQ